MKKVLTLSLLLLFSVDVFAGEVGESIDSDTTGKITAVISDDAEESGEAEDSGGAADFNLINSETSGDITLGGGEEDPE